ncbi:Bug family tripartite tricarboxylate transporter substrate binding protein [Achromobacter aloeverae]|uniref:LacI family transcriptional regulator n=1 Tax=Achromobacter aloeverae TaxID=1750518 RepID=A0A4Q1HFW1_9BURK|nr:tripartite tricarboxylate transporter substrate binding protein [Achromobacter aloeverae]RXN85932.1 LacI family transcriptional regulator [Achromobacter aloeverae]
MKSLLGKCVLSAAALVVTAAAAMAPASARAAYPDHPIKLVVPFTAAGTVDMVGRALAEKLSAKLGQPVIVDNKAGATGQIGSSEVSRAEPDGYTLLLMSATVHTVSPNLKQHFPFDPIDGFTPISEVVSFPYVMVVSASSPYKTVADLVRAAKAKPNAISYGSFGPGSGPHLISELFALSTGTKLLHVPYKGAAPALTDVMGGQITFFIDSLPSPLGQIKGGKLRPLAVTTLQRSPTVPDVPTMSETIPGFEAIAWLGVAAPPKTPRPVVMKLYQALAEISKDQAYGDKLRAVGLEPVVSESPEAFRTWLLAQKQYWGDVVRKADIPMID